MEQQNFFYLVLLYLLKYVKDFEDYGLNKDHNDNNNDKKKNKKTTQTATLPRKSRNCH